MNIPKHPSIAEFENPAFEIEISYTDQEVADKLTHYGLNQSLIFNQLKINVKQLESTVSTHQTDSNPFLVSIKSALLACPSKPNLSEFTAYINQLIFLWLSAIQSSTNIQIILNLISCLES